MFRVEGDRRVRMHSRAGIVGSKMKAPQIESAQLDESSVLLVYTDGISDRSSFDDYPQLRFQSAAIVADAIVARYGKRHDDATCVAFRYAR